MNFAYRTEVLHEGSWKVFDVLVSEPGQAVRDTVNGVKEDYQDKVRIRRIKTIKEFTYLAKRVPLRVRKGAEGEVVFEDGYLEPKND